VLQVVHGLGDTGAALCRSGVDKIAFVGSTATGKKVMATCAETLTPLVAECGGKDAMIVDADADVDAAADAALFGACCNAGQTCTGIERVYVASEVADEFIERLGAGARKLKVSELGAVLRRHAEPAVRRRRRLRVRAHPRRRWAARVRAVEVHHDAPCAVAAACLDV
jgi:aldehyde dehydrogenase (NAD+)